MAGDSRYQVSITFSEPEARLLAHVVFACLPHMTRDQKRLALTICEKFERSGRALIDQLVDEHGVDRANEIAKAIIAEHPEADEFTIGKAA